MNNFYIDKSKTKYFWVISGNCNYENFDFAWAPDEETYDHLHVFPSNEQLYGDTFFIDKHSFAIKSKDLVNFKHYQTINFNKQQNVKRLGYDEFVIQHYNFAKAIKNSYQQSKTKYFWLRTNLAKEVDFEYNFEICHLLVKMANPFFDLNNFHYQAYHFDFL